jgi:hypothetical protein
LKPTRKQRRVVSGPGCDWFDGDGNRMTPSHAVKKGTRYRYYVSCSLITKDRTENAAALRIPAAEIEQLVSDRVHRWLLDPGNIDKSTSARFADPSIQHRRVARAAEIGEHWPELPVARIRLSYLAPDITQAILDGRQPRDLTPEKLLDHSRLPLAWRDQRIVLGFG